MMTVRQTTSPMKSGCNDLETLWQSDWLCAKIDALTTYNSPDYLNLIAYTYLNEHRNLYTPKDSDV